MSGANPTFATHGTERHTNHNLMRRLLLVLLPLALVLGACAPYVMGGAAASDVAGSLQGTYAAGTADVFLAAQHIMMMNPGWTVAGNDAELGYMRIESSSTRARLFAAPVTVTEYVSLTVRASSTGGAAVSIDYTEAGASIAQSVLADLNTRFQWGSRIRPFAWPPDAQSRVGAYLRTVMCQYPA